MKIKLRAVLLAPTALLVMLCLTQILTRRAEGGPGGRIVDAANFGGNMLALTSSGEIYVRPFLGGPWQYFTSVPSAASTPVSITVTSTGANGNPAMWVLSEDGTAQFRDPSTGAWTTENVFGGTVTPVIGSSWSGIKARFGKVPSK